MLVEHKAVQVCRELLIPLSLRLATLRLLAHFEQDIHKSGEVYNFARTSLGEDERHVLSLKVIV